VPETACGFKSRSSHHSKQLNYVILLLLNQRHGSVQARFRQMTVATEPVVRISQQSHHFCRMKFEVVDF